ncbi:sigma-70 family RNA polymerase sigma factor [Myxococcus sp. CA051A]|uniref:RNA polymerase sigma factor n=1 Tax=unclassified Myxococcus TaxID=2648731 RepID=UPI00157B44E8|nr:MULTISPECIES: sigma-70 family RNA polymerase sigma factor [unclassified Myxococcus]NTX39254.1 sigma-70 family RNA polymerase sigma factor [Myxococcus sp. CA033]NTX65585.1 sigma-70 family RNA polymerase sigma factor [Myxococcus sp. CA051A]
MRPEQEESSASGSTRFEALWSQHQRALLRICERTLGDLDAAREAMSRTGVRVWLQMSRSSSQEEWPWALLRRVAINVCIDLQRERRRQSWRWTSLDEELGDGAELEAARPCGEQEEQQLQSLLLELLESLPPQLRACARLAFVEQQGYADIAATLRLTPANVRKIVERSRKRLVQPLAQAGVIRDEASFHRWLSGRRKRTDG